MIAEQRDSRINYYDYFNLLHSKNDKRSFIGFLHKKPLAGIEHTLLSNNYMMSKINKKFRDGYINDMYMTLNTFYRQERSVSNLRWINALYIDLDCYKNNITKESALFFLNNDHFGRDIPNPSMIVDSGRGLYLIFLLEHVPSQARPLWDALQKNFQKKLEYLGADPGAIDAARVLRIPGSINSKTNTEVEVVEFNDNLYDIQELKLNYLPDLNLNRKKKKTIKKKGNITYIFNPNSLQMSRVRDIEKLVELRNGEMSGLRERTLFLYRYFLSLKNKNEELVCEKTLELNQNFSEPLSEREALSATNNCKEKALINKYKFRNITIIELLDITAEEQKHLTTLIQQCEKNERRKKVRREERRDKNNLTERQRKKVEKLHQVSCLLEKGYSAKEISIEMVGSLSQTYRDIQELKKEEIIELIEKYKMHNENPENEGNSMGLLVSHEMSSYIDALASVSSFLGEDLSWEVNIWGDSS